MKILTLPLMDLLTSRINWTSGLVKSVPVDTSLMDWIWAFRRRSFSPSAESTTELLRGGATGAAGAGGATAELLLSLAADVSLRLTGAASTLEPEAGISLRRTGVGSGSATGAGVSLRRTGAGSRSAPVADNDLYLPSLQVNKNVGHHFTKISQTR